MEVCEFCSVDADTESTSMTGAYCIDCLRLVWHECSEAIKKLQERKQGKKKTGQGKGKVTKEQYDNALEALLHDPRDA